MNEYCVCGHIKGGHLEGLCYATDCSCIEYRPTPTASPCEKCAELEAELAKLSADHPYLIVHHNRVLDKWAIIRANIRHWAVAWKRLARARAHRCEDCGAPASRHEAESDVWFCNVCYRNLAENETESDGAKE